jgi:[acyl-carrier-protein] S-malonyltransferase
MEMGKIAFVFSGQGAQYSGMGMELAQTSAAAAAVFAMADEIRPGTSEQCFTGTADELKQTINTQPCVFCVDLAAAEALREQGIQPDMAAGFSLGEIPALAFSGKLAKEDAFRFVVERSKEMHRCGSEHPGTMFAVMGIGPGAVEEACSRVSGSYPVNYNGPMQTVVACTEEAAAAFPAEVVKVGGKSVRLPVSGGFHSPLMKQARTVLEENFGHLKISDSRIPVYANVTAQPYGDNDLLFRQIDSPVLWHPTIMEMNRQGVDTFIEVGPGKTLINMITKFLPTAKVLSVENKETLRTTMEELKDAGR